ncbi:hypothetical protein N7471_010386 [Penicillium samsonianum]|uniref:uncharacterized protein n=1 Tax=Penicillium samsonianum TaxID=1882272 RepID=UPI0025492CC2|nr:uncharacterized protein N7471_010386 [Penicillium samsonianum]KAJ6125893.1 hypothetical protein N7471_010386 [Penicillium samsonianum]
MDGVEVNSLGHILYTRLAAHAARLVQQRFLRNNIIPNSTTDRLDSVSLISRILERQIQLPAGERMCAQALAGYEKALGLDHTSTLDAVNNLGNLYLDQDKMKCSKLRMFAGYDLGRNN